MKLAIALFLCLCQSALAATWYVRPGVWTTVDGSGHPIPTAGVYGAQDGTSYADAWNGITSIVWGGGGVSAGDTLYVCGTHVYRIFVNAGSLTSQAVSTIGASSFTMRGDYPGDAGTLFGGNVNYLGAGAAYHGPDSNGVWYQVLNSSGTVPPTFYTNGLVRLKQRTASTWADGLGGQFKVGTTNYVQIPGGIVPTTNNMAQGSSGWAFDFNNKTNITIKNLTIVSGFSGANDFYAFRYGVPTAPFTTAPKDIVFKDCVVRDTKSFYLYPGFDRWIFAGNNWGPAGDGPYSLINAQTNAPQALIFTNNFFHDMDTLEWPSVDGHGIGIQGGNGHVISHNSISNTGPAILLWTGNVAMKNNTVSYNFIQKTHINSQGVSDGIGISGDNSLAVFGLRTGNKIYGNVIRSCAAGGGATYQGVGIQCNSADYTEIYNNTIEDVNVGIDWEVAQASSPVSGKVVDNIIDNVASKYYYIVGTAAVTNLTVDYNLYSPSGFPSTLSPSTTHDTHSITNASPSFLVTPPTALADFGIQGSSPAISNSGVSAGYLEDITGLTIPTSGYNIGAFYQYHVTIPTTCDFLSISNAVLHQAQEGDTVDIAAGSCTISNTLNLTTRYTSFTIQGQGTNSTTLTSGALTRAFYVNRASANVFTIHDLNCIENAANSFGFWDLEGTNTFHVYNLQMTNILSRGVNWGASGSRGLIEYSRFISASGSPQSISFAGWGYHNWTNANPLGTTNTLCVENCYFENQLDLGNGYFDAYDGAQLVFRHNDCVGYAPSGVHGYDSQPTSCRTWEIYSNSFSNYRANSVVIELRGGTGVVYGNTASGSDNFCQLAYYRSCASAHSSSVDSYGVPGQGQSITFTGNPTNNQIAGILVKTSYPFKSVYTPNSNPTGLNGYGGGNVVIGSTLLETLTNLYNCINQGPGSGVTWAPSASVDSGTGFNHDFLAIAITGGNTIVLTNALDGNTDQYGYPANQQTGVIKSYPLSSSSFLNDQELLPAYSWNNTLNGTNAEFTLKDDTLACNHNITNLVKLNRDYFVDTAMPGYTPLVFPHPLSAFPGTNTPPPTPTGFSYFPGIKRKGF